MTREELRTIINGITDEQLGKILDINSKDIGKAKEKTDDLKSDIQRLKDELEKKDKTITELKTNVNNTEKLQAKINEYEEAEKQRKKEEQERNIEQEITKRFNSVSEEKKFINELTKSGIYAEFKKAVLSDENKGKGDKNIFEDLIKDRANIFENPNKPQDIARVGKSTGELEDKPSVPNFF